MIFGVYFGHLTTILTKNFVQNGVYRVWNVHRKSGKKLVNIRDGVCRVIVALRFALMPYTLD